MDNKEEKKILIVDDEESIRTVFEEILTAQGYKVDTAENGHIGVEKIREKKYDIAFIDMVMTDDMSGLDFYRKLKEISPHTKAIMMTAYVAQDLMEKALEEGADHAVYKPFSSDNIIDMAAAVLKEQNNSGDTLLNSSN